MSESLKKDEGIILKEGGEFNKKPRKKRTIKKTERDEVTKLYTRFGIAFLGTVAIFIGVMVFAVFKFKIIVDDIYQTYVLRAQEIVNTKESIESINDWERLPVNQRKEILRRRYFDIVRYYTIDVPENQKMGDEQILETFNVLFDTTVISGRVNFFLPVAFMKVHSNFNPNLDRDFQFGLAELFLKEGENFANLPLVRESEVFRVSYNGKVTLQYPADAIKLLVAKMDDLMKTFGNREDWVILSLMSNEYEVISEYWDAGNGTIPDSFYEDSNLVETLKYYDAFRDGKIISTNINE